MLLGLVYDVSCSCLNKGSFIFLLYLMLGLVVFPVSWLKVHALSL